MKQKSRPAPFMDEISWVDLVEAEKPNKEMEYEEEGELAIDLYEDDERIILVALVAGVDPENLSITVRNDLITIRGVRKSPVSDAVTRHSESFWGAFSRTIILPADVIESSVSARLKRGVLFITITKAANKRISIIDEDSD